MSNQRDLPAFFGLQKVYFKNCLMRKEPQKMTCREWSNPGKCLTLRNSACVHCTSVYILYMIREVFLKRTFITPNFICWITYIISCGDGDDTSTKLGTIWGLSGRDGGEGPSTISSLCHIIHLPYNFVQDSI